MIIQKQKRSFWPALGIQASCDDVLLTELNGLLNMKELSCLFFFSFSFWPGAASPWLKTSLSVLWLFALSALLIILSASLPVRKGHEKYPVPDFPDPLARAFLCLSSSIISRWAFKPSSSSSESKKRFQYQWTLKTSLTCSIGMPAESRYWNLHLLYMSQSDLWRPQAFNWS